MARLLVLVPTLAAQLLLDFGFDARLIAVMPNAPLWSVADIPEKQFQPLCILWEDVHLIGHVPSIVTEQEIAA